MKLQQTEYLPRQAKTETLDNLPACVKLKEFGLLNL